MRRDSRPARDLVALAGIALGVIPIVGLTIGAGPSGLFRWIFGGPSTSTSWVIAIAVVVIGLAAVLSLERAKPADER